MPTDSTAGDDDEDDFVDQWADPDSDDSNSNTLDSDEADSDAADIEQPFGDPEKSELIPKAPSVTNYEIEEPDAKSLGEDISDVDPDLLNIFAVSVLLTNVAVLLISVGILLAIFRGMTELGIGLVLLGGLALVRVRQQYRAYKRDREVDSGTGSDTNSDSDSDADSTVNSDFESDTHSGHNR